jgi:hypothetical protein
MAKTKISEFSSTPANNTDIDSINIAEGCAPSGINDAIRELMAQLKDFQTGAAGDSFNGPVGTTTAAAGAFTTLSASGAVTLSGGTANGVPYLNGSKVLTTGSALTFDGTTLGTNRFSMTGFLATFNNDNFYMEFQRSGTPFGYIGTGSNTAGGAVTDLGIRAQNNLVFAANGTEQMRLTSTGLGLGVTPSAWDGSLFKTLQLVRAGGAYLTSFNGSLNMQLGYNVYYGSGAYRYSETGTAARYIQTSGEHQWYNAPSGTAGNAISFTQAMTLDASGRLGIGETSPSYALDVRKDSGTWEILRIKNTTSTAAALITATSSGGGSVDFGAAPDASTFVVRTGGTERARIDSSGNLLVGTTTNHITSKAFVYGTAGTGNVCLGTSTASSTNYAAIFNTSNTTQAGYIFCSGTTTSYSTSSDYRLKEDIQPMTGALAKVAALKPCTYKWKADGSDGEGFIAHELAKVVPQCVTGEKDAVDADGRPKYQGIDTSFLVATLTAAIQELKADLDATKAELAALKGNP